ncbi:hypothetical protein FRC14_006944 [Serendipita sp. 396]|nr:hypothetical protein FRC14_006944 [Serendipita sp. 396]KAG8775364.1 hypothetical protein FRC16_004835 [Serendipita sp. 398]
MQVELGGVVSSECVEIAKPVGRAAFLGVVVDDVDEEDEEVESGNGTSETESCEDENRLETHALGQRRGRRGSGGSRTLLDEGQDEEDGEEGEEDEEEEDVERPLSPPLTPTAASPEGNLLTAPDSAGGAPRIRGAYPPQMRRRKRGRSSGAARQTLEGTTGKSKAHMEGGEEKATSTTTTAAVEEVDDAKSRARVDASTSSIRSKSVLRRATRAAKTASILSTADFKKYPSLVLTTSLQAMFPNLNTEIAKTMHLQRVWENVVACKEAMWEEFLHDSAQREREAAAAAQAQSSTSSSSQSGHSSGSGKFIGALSSGIGGMGGMGAMGVMGGLGSLPIPSPFLASRRVATLLDELEWADSDMRRSERERFDILLDRYEMRIRRHCARAYENSGIPCLVARDRQGWANAEAGLDSSDDEMYDDPVPPSPAPPLPRQGGSGTTPPSASTSSSSGSTPPNSQRDYLESSSSAALAASLASRDGSHGRSYDDPSSSSHGREEHSSSDEITLAEPQSPRSRLATGKGRAGGMSSSVSPVSPVAPPFGRDNFSPSSMSSSISPTGTLSTRMQSSYFGGSSASGSTEGMSVPSTSSPIDLSREREKRRMRSTSIRKRLEEDKDDDLLGPEKLPSRIIKAFIATKTQPT